MWLSGYRTEIAPKVARPSSNGKVSGSIPDAVVFSHCWFKLIFNLYSLSSFFIDKIAVDDLF